MLVVILTLAAVSGVEDWKLLTLHWWIWLLVAAPALLLTIDLVLAWRGRGIVRSRAGALGLLAVLVVANLFAVAILVAALATTSIHDLGGVELLVTAVAIWLANVIVFGLLFWELDSGGPTARLRRARTSPDFGFPQDDDSSDVERWSPRAWDYLYVSLTNSIAFSPTDTMPLSLSAKGLMALESAIAAFTVLLVLARAVNVIGS